MKPLWICACIRDEAPYLAEWIAFHRLVGVTGFVLYDDGSTDRTRKILDGMQFSCVVVLDKADGWDRPEFDGLENHLGWHRATQCRAFTHYLREFRSDEWCAFIDPDEYLFDCRDDYLPAVLDRHYRGQCAVVTNWLVFGSNGHATKPPGLTIESYTRRGQPGEPRPYGTHVKAIVDLVRPCRFGPYGSHCPVFDDGSSPVDQLGRPNPWSMTTDPLAGPLRLHHYFHRSADEAVAKLTKGYSQFPGYPGVERLRLHDRNEVLDETILRFVPRLKETLGCD